jgi:hypothetical protein
MERAFTRSKGDARYYQNAGAFTTTKFDHWLSYRLLALEAFAAMPTFNWTPSFFTHNVFDFPIAPLWT